MDARHVSYKSTRNTLICSVCVLMFTHGDYFTISLLEYQGKLRFLLHFFIEFLPNIMYTIYEHFQKFIKEVFLYEKALHQ